MDYQKFDEAENSMILDMFERDGKSYARVLTLIKDKEGYYTRTIGTWPISRDSFCVGQMVRFGQVKSEIIGPDGKRESEIKTGVIPKSDAKFADKTNQEERMENLRWMVKQSYNYNPKQFEEIVLSNPDFQTGDIPEKEKIIHDAFCEYLEMHNLFEIGMSMIACEGLFKGSRDKLLEVSRASGLDEISPEGKRLPKELEDRLDQADVKVLDELFSKPYDLFLEKGGSIEASKSVIEIMEGRVKISDSIPDYMKLMKEVMDAEPIVLDKTALQSKINVPDTIEYKLADKVFKLRQKLAKLPGYLNTGIHNYSEDVKNNIAGIKAYVDENGYRNTAKSILGTAARNFGRATKTVVEKIGEGAQNVKDRVLGK